MAESAVRITTGSLSFEGGVDSQKVPTIASPSYPHGLGQNQISWLENATVRGGGITPRPGWKRLLEMPETARFQGGFMYRDIQNQPYIITQIGGRIYQVRVDTDNSVVDLSLNSGLTNPSDTDKAFFVQGEQFCVIQAGDYFTLPLFWDGAALVRSRGQVPPNTILPNPTFTVPPLFSQDGSTSNVALVNLSAPYAGATNQIFMIDGYRYQQVLYNQQYRITGFQYGGPDAAIHNGSFTVPAASILRNALIPAQVSTVLTPDLNFTFNPTGFQTNQLKPIFFVETNVAAQLPEILNTVLSNGFTVPSIRFSVVQDLLPAPGANQVYLINLDDPRSGFAVTPASGQAGYSQLPAGGPMDYYMGRIWTANGQEYLAGDIVGGPSGSARYNFKDSILYITENDYLTLGGAFTIPSESGIIRALKHPANLDTALGEGQLLVFTSNTIYSVNVTPTRAQWKTLAEPIQRVAMINMGTLSDTSVVAVNGDLFFQAEDGVQSFIQAIRYFGQWGNVPISSEENRVTVLNDRNLLRYGSGILLDNRMIQTCLPEESDIGTIHKGLMPLDFDLISTLAQRYPPAWEGVQEGLDILEILSGDFGGAKRAFAFVRSDAGKIELWEMTQDLFEDQNLEGPARVTWVVETPSYTWDRLFKLKELETIELWIDRLYGDVDFTVYFRPDQHPCWEYWHHWQVCAARNQCETPWAPVPCNYPQQPYRQLYKATMVLPKPPSQCQDTQSRPMNIGYSFQFRIVVKGRCRIRGLMVHGIEKDKQPFLGIQC